MDTVVFVFRIIFIVLGSLIALIYLLFQLFQKLPQEKIKLSTADYIVLFATALIFGFGTNSYYGLLAFAPLLLAKILFRFLLQPKKLQGSGRWVEVNWKKLSLKGFDRRVPQNYIDEMNKMPKDNHFVIPRFYMLIFIKFISKRMGKEMSKAPAGVSQNQQQQAVGQFTSLIEGIVKLEKGKTERKDFPFGSLKVTRL